MRGINRVTLVGNLGKDPELKTIQDNLSVVRITLATTETYLLKDGNRQSQTEWHTIIAWRGLATLAASYLQKGSLVYIEGTIHYRQYNNKNGLKVQVTEIIADKLVILDKKQPHNSSASQTGELPSNDQPPF
jgi:single-strand DNA-binding protein